MKYCIWLLLLFSTVAYSTPSRIIILRHAEKKDDLTLCDIGEERSVALRDQYLGKGASQSLFPTDPPSAIFATTLHTLESASPTAWSWRVPIIAYAALPLPNESIAESNDRVNKQTELAAANLMQDPRWNGTTVVMVWEHRHIANANLAKAFPALSVELRQLLKIEMLPEDVKSKIPQTWNDSNYNFFWIIEYDDKENPIAFNIVRQNFTGKFAHLPNNDWGAPENLSESANCEK